MECLRPEKASNEQRDNWLHFVLIVLIVVWSPRAGSKVAVGRGRGTVGCVGGTPARSTSPKVVGEVAPYARMEPWNSEGRSAP